MISVVPTSIRVCVCVCRGGRKLIFFAGWKVGQGVLCGNRCPWYSIIISREPSITRETRNLFTIPLVQFVAEAVNRFEISVPAAAQPFAEGEYSGAQFERLSIYLSIYLTVIQLPHQGLVKSFKCRLVRARRSQLSGL